MVFKFINLQPKPKFRPLKAQEPNPTNHAIWARPLGHESGMFGWFGRVSWLAGQP